MRSFHTGPFLSRGEQCRLLHQRTYERQFRNIRHASNLATKPREATTVGDGRTRLSQLWTPTGGIAASSDEDAQAKLIRAGFLRQAHSGIFHMLPLGRRVQDKLEALIDKHMYGLGASKVSLSSISSQELWTKSGRLANVGSELFQFKDRKDASYLLSPTHEEEITTLVSSTVNSYKQLPIRLYQISRKYRDERRPRQGLLRSREFIMKDLYTFDYSSALALDTYHQVRVAYSRIFDELKLPYLVAEADSGDIGGDLSHEYHFPTSKGEDHIISCTSCNYVTNEELAENPFLKANVEIEETEDAAANVELWHGISKDRNTLINVWYASPPGSTGTTKAEVNARAVKAIFPELDSSIDDPLALWATSSVSSPDEVVTPQRLINFLDHSLSSLNKDGIRAIGSHLQLYPASMNDAFKTLEVKIIFEDSFNDGPLSLLRIRDGDVCPRCFGGKLQVQKAIELGHTFHLGTRYSKPLAAKVKVPVEILIAEKNRLEDISLPADSTLDTEDSTEGVKSLSELIDKNDGAEENKTLPELVDTENNTEKMLAKPVALKDDTEEVKIPSEPAKTENDIEEAPVDLKEETEEIKVLFKPMFEADDTTGAKNGFEATIGAGKNTKGVEDWAEPWMNAEENTEDAMITTKATIGTIIGTEPTKPETVKPRSGKFSEVHMEMGCHGIGVSRIIGAVADTLADSEGLNWPRVMAPYEVVIIAGKGNEDAGVEVYDVLANSELDIILDDRTAFFPWKMQDADLIGYPIIVVLGRRWKSEQRCEVQCRRLGTKKDVSIVELTATVTSLLEKL